MHEHLGNSKYAATSREAVRPPRGIRKRLRGSARDVALSVLSAVTADAPGPFLRCLYLHHVFDDQRERFRAILEMLLGFGAFVDTDTCVRMVRGERPIDGRYFHLSFDDGFRDVYRNGVPVLRELNIPAIVFVPTSVIGSDWETTRRYSLETTGHDGVVEVMTWGDLEELRAEGFDVGSHTRTHARLSALRDEASLRDEVEGSKREIEDRLGVECRYFAWPYGRPGDVTEASLALAGAAGFQASFGAHRGSVEPGTPCDPFRIPRHNVDSRWPLGHVRYFVAGKLELFSAKARPGWRPSSEGVHS